jgi:putative restriction endonuclease
MRSGRKWTRDELLVALNLYRKLSFGQLHARNPVILQLAEARGAEGGLTDC